MFHVWQCLCLLQQAEETAHSLSNSAKQLVEKRDLPEMESLVHDDPINQAIDVAERIKRLETELKQKRSKVNGDAIQTCKLHIAKASTMLDGFLTEQGRQFILMKLGPFVIAAGANDDPADLCKLLESSKNWAELKLESVLKNDALTGFLEVGRVILNMLQAYAESLKSGICVEANLAASLLKDWESHKHKLAGMVIPAESGNVGIVSLIDGKLKDRMLKAFSAELSRLTEALCKAITQSLDTDEENHLMPCKEFDDLCEKISIHAASVKDGNEVASMTKAMEFGTNVFHTAAAARRIGHSESVFVCSTIPLGCDAHGSERLWRHAQTRWQDCGPGQGR